MKRVCTFNNMVKIYFGNKNRPYKISGAIGEAIWAKRCQISAPMM